MKKEAEVFFPEDAWNVLRKHFMESGGLFDQIEHGRNIRVSLGDQPEDDQELEEIKQALMSIHHSWEGMDALPRWQVCLLWSVAPRLEVMLRDTTEPLMVHILHARLFTWIELALSNTDQERSSEYLMIHDIMIHMKGLKGFSTQLRFGSIDLDAFEELIQAVNVLSLAWKEQSMVPRVGAWLLLLVPIQSWDAKVYKGEQRKQLAEMRLRLYALIDECFC
ncbi:MAG: hypothetical protein JO031_08885 [Ktedonobacteraceae bacterium]|nr:hypothetical protein [Ktedonobacteraceae bacterium]